MKVLSSMMVLGIGFLMMSGSPARAQFGEMGDAVKKGATDAAKQEALKAAGVPTPVTPAAAPAADTGAAAAPAGEPQAAPGAAKAPVAAPGSETGAAGAPAADAPADEQ